MVREWRDNHPGEAVPDQLVLTQPWPATSSEKARGIPDRVIYYQFRHDRARRTLRGSMSRSPKPNGPLTGTRRSNATGSSSYRGHQIVNRELEAKTRAFAGWKGYADVGVMPTGGVC